ALFLDQEATDFFSARVVLGCYVNNVLYEFDYASIYVKKECGLIRLAMGRTAHERGQAAQDNSYSLTRRWRRVRTKRGRSVALAAVVAAGLALVVSACGGGGGGSSNATTSSTSGKTFPVLKVVNGTTD